MKTLIYCTKAKPYLYKMPNNKNEWFLDSELYRGNDYEDRFCSGKIVAEFDGEVEELACELLDTGVGCESIYYTNTVDNIYNKSCLTQYELEDYLGSKAGGEIVSYAIHIENLNAYDTPKELSDYMPICKGLYDAQEYYNFFFSSQDEFAPQVKKAPQNMMYVSSNGFDKLCLISIRPEWVAKILNGEKTIEVRKQILKDMLTNKID